MSPPLLLIDTNILSEARRPRGNAPLKKFLKAADSRSLFISVITIGEIAHGIARLPDGERRKTLDAWFGQIESTFADRVLSIDLTTAKIWGELSAGLAAQGRSIDPADGLIAATARRHHLSLVTRNTRHFEGTGVPLIDPFA